jgi:hypothetical protein
MKKGKFIFSALIGIALMVSNVFGSEVEKNASERSAENSVRVQLAQLLSPEEIGGNKGEISVVFSSFPATPFKIVHVTGSNQELVKKFTNRLQRTPLLVPEAMYGHSYSITIHFSELEEMPVRSERGSILRKELFSILSSSQIYENGRVKVTVSVKNSKATLVTVEGENKKLVTSVEDVLKNSSMNVNSEISGNYTIPVKF